MSLELYFAYLATVAVFFFGPPGPSQTLMIANSLRYGARRCRATIAGDLSANALQMSAAAFGLAAVVASNAEALTLLKWLGVGYLVYVGLRTFFAPPMDLQASGAAAPNAAALYRQAFLTSAANPKAVFFFAALFPQSIDPSLAIWPQLIILGATYLLVDGVLLLIWGGAAERLLGGLKRSGRWLNRLSGGLMIAAAALLGLKDVDARAQ